MLATLAIDALAAYRLTRLVTRDHLTKEARAVLVATAYEAAEVVPRGTDRWQADDWLEHVEHDPRPPLLAKLITCSWCAGVYVAGSVVAARAVGGRPWDLAARVLATAAVVGLLAEHE